MTLRGEFDAERRLGPDRPVLDIGSGRAYEALGDRGRARTWYRRALARDPGNWEARAALDALDHGRQP